MQTHFSSADLALARRIEAAEAATGLAVADVKRAASPQSEAIAEPFAGGYAVFGGVGSPMTHALGIGMNGPIETAEFDRMEEFFRSHGSASLIDLCPMADPTIVRLVQERGYRVIEFNNVMARPVDGNESCPQPADGCRTQRAEAADALTWIRAVAQGFLESEDVPEEFIVMMSGTMSMADCFLALLN